MTTPQKQLWAKFIFAWDANITKFFIASRLQDMYQAGGKPYCQTFNSFLNHALPNSDLWAGKNTSVRLTGQEILQILRYNVDQAVSMANRAFDVENNLAKYEAIIFIHSWSILLETQQAGLMAYEAYRKNKIYCKNFLIPETIWISGRQTGHNWLTEIGITRQNNLLERDVIRDLYRRYDAQRTEF